MLHPHFNYEGKAWESIQVATLSHYIGGCNLGSLLVSYKDSFLLEKTDIRGQPTYMNPLWARP